MSYSVVIFDASPNHRRLMTFLLLKQGLSVQTFPCEWINPAQLEGLHPDLLIVGCLKGDIDSEIELLHMIQTHVAGSGISILICTTNLELLGTHVECLGIQRLRLLSKPFDANEFLAAVRQALNFQGADGERESRH